jgi:hypothetical protein
MPISHASAIVQQLSLQINDSMVAPHSTSLATGWWTWLNPAANEAEHRDGNNRGKEGKGETCVGHLSQLQSLICTCPCDM